MSHENVPLLPLSPHHPILLPRITETRYQQSPFGKFLKILHSIPDNLIPLVTQTATTLWETAKEEPSIPLALVKLLNNSSLFIFVLRSSVDLNKALFEIAASGHGEELVEAMRIASQTALPEEKQNYYSPPATL